MNLLFQTDGSWDNTALFESGQGLNPAELWIEVNCSRDGEGNIVRGGTMVGGELCAYYRLADQPALQQPVFPGVIELKFAEHVVRLEHPSPILDIASLQVYLDGIFISDHLVGLLLQVDADQGVMMGQIEVLEPHTFSPDVVATISLI